MLSTGGVESTGVGAVYGMTEVHVGAVLTRANSAVSTGTIGTDPLWMSRCRVTSSEYRGRKGGHKCMRERMHNSQVGRARFARAGLICPMERASQRAHSGAIGAILKPLWYLYPYLYPYGDCKYWGDSARS